ncbi:MAG: AAA family ATPase, partial [Caulobacteraceae bacterium]
MLTGLGIRDVVLIESLELELGSGLTVLTGETGGGKSIILDALGLATGARTDAGLIRTGAAQASSTAVFTVPDGHPVLALLEERGLAPEPGEDLILRRQLSADGRTRAFINDQAAAIGVLREAAQSLLEVHGQHETVGLLDARTHRPLLDDFGGLAVAPVVKAWADWRTARQAAEAARAAAAKSGEEVEILSAWLAELDRLDPREGEETELAAARALLGASEKALAEISTAKDALTGGDVAGRLGQAARALSRALERTAQAGVAQDNAAVRRLTEAAAAIERALVEADEAAAGIDAAALAFDFDPAGLDKAEERLFALRA